MLLFLLNHGLILLVISFTIFLKEEIMKYIIVAVLALQLSGCSVMPELDSYGTTSDVRVAQNISTNELLPGTKLLPPYVTENPRDRQALASDPYVSEAHNVTFPDVSCGVQQGDIVIYTGARKLLFVTACGEGKLYPIAVGREGMQWAGSTTVERATPWPDWRPPEEMRIREAVKGHDLPVMMPGGLDNPLGARAIYLAGTPYRIHGTNKPESIGTDASSGCIRMHNADVMDLYSKVRVGARVYVLDKNGMLPNKIAVQN